MNKLNENKGKNFLSRNWISGAVIIYLVSVGTYTLLAYFSEGENRFLTSNEFGDFLAGVFSPLAFLFLYLGYKQNSESIRLQNEELKASTRALELQVKEMRESVEQQKIMSELQRTELEERHNSIAPILKFEGLVLRGSSSLTFNITLKNISENIIKHLSIESDDVKTKRYYDVLSQNNDIDYFINGSEEEFELIKDKKNIERIFTIEYENILGRRFHIELKVSYILENEKWFTLNQQISNNILSR
ncbi:hypothetical protein [Acinetobacter pittii]|uniref:hypothetical protein n=1 Tax=Acinetobacter pittii TaxID=48296 RepID=UPI001D060FD0|nr:hypothetical protein [Acinetobacter pittii]